MNLEPLYSVVSRLLFVGAFGLLALVVLEAGLNALHFTVLRGAYSKGRLLELAAVMLVFVIALLLRQIRDGLKRTG